MFLANRLTVTVGQIQPLLCTGKGACGISEKRCEWLLALLVCRKFSSSPSSRGPSGGTLTCSRGNDLGALAQPLLHCFVFAQRHVLCDKLRAEPLRGLWKEDESDLCRA